MKGSRIVGEVVIYHAVRLSTPLNAQDCYFGPLKRDGISCVERCRSVRTTGKRLICGYERASDL